MPIEKERKRRKKKKMQKMYAVKFARREHGMDKAENGKVKKTAKTKKGMKKQVARH